MTLPPQTQAILLLTAHFSKSNPHDVKPLSPTEWGKFALWLKDEGKKPELLLSDTLAETLSGWSDKRVTRDRISRLLDRGSALGIAAEKWFRSGLWVLARFDANYPIALKKRLKEVSPPIFFGCGNPRLLNQDGIAVVGSRNAPESDLAYASQLGAAAATAGLSIISGGAKGIDEAAMLGALNSEGTAVGVLADNLLRASLSQKYRKHLSNNNLVLISSNYPEAGFTVGNAMGRNKYIYCLSNVAVVVHSGTKGGTHTGAIENLKKGWVPLWVKPTNDNAAGNSELVDNGGTWLESESADQGVALILDRKKVQQFLPENTDIFPALRPASEPPPEFSNSITLPTITNSDRKDVQSKPETSESELNFYDLFISKMREACKNGELSRANLDSLFDLKKTQLTEWLNRAVDEGTVVKRNNPVRYSMFGGGPQNELFDD